jgi:hypothetical protein
MAVLTTESSLGYKVVFIKEPRFGGKRIHDYILALEASPNPLKIC